MKYQAIILYYTVYGILWMLVEPLNMSVPGLVSRWGPLLHIGLVCGPLVLLGLYTLALGYPMVMLGIRSADSSGNKRLEAYRRAASKAQRRLVITGVGMTHLVYDLDHKLLEIAGKVDIEFLMLDPEKIETDKAFAHAIDDFFNIPGFSGRVRAAFDAIDVFCKNWNTGNHNTRMRLRVYDTFPTYSLVMCDPGSKSESSVIEFFRYRCGIDRIRLELKRGLLFESRIMKSVRDIHKAIWDNSREIH